MAAGVPLLVASLSGGDGVDATVSFLLHVNLKLTKEEEENERSRVLEEKEEEHQEEMQVIHCKFRDGVPLTKAELEACLWQSQGMAPSSSSSSRGGRGRRGGSGVFLGLLHTPLVVALVVGNGSVLIVAGCAVSVRPTLCSLRLSTGPSFWWCYGFVM